MHSNQLLMTSWGNMLFSVFAAQTTCNLCSLSYTVYVRNIHCPFWFSWRSLHWFLIPCLKFLGACKTDLTRIVKADAVEVEISCLFSPKGHGRQYRSAFAGFLLVPLLKNWSLWWSKINVIISTSQLSFSENWNFLSKSFNTNCIHVM